MPVCEISYAKNVFSEKEEQRIVERMSRLLLKAESLPDNAISRSICYVNLIESGKMYIGGQLSESGKILIKIYAFHDAFTEAQKKEIYAATKQIFIEEHAFSKQSEGNNIWCIILPLGDMNFGVGGIPVNWAMVQQITNS